MKREYNTGEQIDVTFFIGKEIEHTPAYGMETLFISGLQPIDEIKKNLKDVKHIFFGANHSFAPETVDEWIAWDKTIMHFLDNGYLCSLDIPMSQVEEFNESGLNEYNNFIPQICVPIPYIKLWNYNTMVKIDDTDFNYSNPGVWSHSLHKLMDCECFTPWDEYSLDTVLK